MNNKIIALMIVCIAVLATAGCMDAPAKVLEESGGFSDADNVYSGGSAERSASGAVMPVPAATPAPTSAPGTALETKIIRTAYVTIEVKDVTASVDSLKALAEAKGGYLSSSSITERANNRLFGTVVIRVPQAVFDTTLAGVKAIGTVKSVSTQGEDVTEEYVDIQARKTSYQNQLAQYNEIMKKAVKVSDVIEIQQQIDRVQTELNRLEGRLKYLDNRIDMSTITVNLQEPEPIGGESGPSFISALNEGIAGFFGMLYGLVVLLLTLLPLIIIIAVAYGIYRWRKGKAPQKAPAEPADKK